MSKERRDLNLFKVFQSVIEHRNLAAAGRELGLTASAVSHALTRLRNMVGDDLFLPGARTMQPTPRALEVAPRIATALSELFDILANKDFVPGTSERVFRIAASDSVCTCLLPPLVGFVLEHAPNIRLRIMPIGRVDLVEQLDLGRLDLVVTWLGQTPPRIRRKQLTVEQETLVVRRGHPLTASRPTLAQLLAYPHLVVEFTGSPDFAVDGFLNDRGVHRRVWIERLLLDNTPFDQLQKLTAVTVPTFAAVPPMLPGTDLVATMSLRMARRVVERDDLVMLDLPYEPLHVGTDMAWHERGDRDAALQWLIDALDTLVGDGGPAPVG